MTDSKDYSPMGWEGTVTGVSGGSGAYSVSVTPALPNFGTLMLFNYRHASQYFIVRGFKCHRNRARGIMVQCPNTVIENSYFYHHMASSIHIGSHNWKTGGGEGLGSRNILIYNNIFEASDATERGNGALFAANLNGDGASSYQLISNLSIIGNTFINTAGKAMVISGVNGLKIRDNTIQNTVANPPQSPYRGQISVKSSSNVEVTGNKWSRSPYQKQNVILDVNVGGAQLVGNVYG
jgi:hypothetical protein